MTLPRLGRAVCCLAFLLAVVLVFGSSVATEAFWAAGTGPDIDAAFARFWKARTREDAARTVRDVIKSGISFDDALARLRRGRLYLSTARRGLVRGERRTIYGNFSYDLWIPDSYDSARRYQVRFQLHGGVSRDQEPSADQFSAESAEREGPGGGRRSFSTVGETAPPRQPLRGAEQIYVLPASWREAPWWNHAQLENLSIILDAVKRTYNVDENRVAVSGISDGGTGTYYVAMRDTTPYASFLPMNGSMMVLSNERLEIDGELFPGNLRNKPLFVVNGGRDPLYPERVVRPFMRHLIRGGVAVDYHPQADAGHDTSWWPSVSDTFEQFVQTHPRTPLPESLTWEVSDRQTPGRAHWLVIDRVVSAGDAPRLVPDLNVLGRNGTSEQRMYVRRRPSGRVDLLRDGNTVRMQTRGVAELTLLISPDAFDLSQPIVVEVNDRRVVERRVERSVETLMKWAARDNDRTALFAAELKVLVQ
jgi:hypothetical protein